MGLTSTLIAGGSLIVSLLVLGASAWNLYLSHYRETRSDIAVHAESRDTPPQFSGGNHAIDDSAFWTGNFWLKVTNAGEKGGYISSVQHSLTEFEVDGERHPPEGASIEVNRSRSTWEGTELEARSSKRFRVSVRITPDSDIGVLANHDSAIIKHALKIEDNKGSYLVNHKTEMGLVGPEGALENWEGS